jgi:hypothetical protein
LQKFRLPNKLGLIAVIITFEIYDEIQVGPQNSVTYHLLANQLLDEVLVLII